MICSKKLKHCFSVVLLNKHKKYLNIAPLFHKISLAVNVILFLMSLHNQLIVKGPRFFLGHGTFLRALPMYSMREFPLDATVRFIRLLAKSKLALGVSVDGCLPNLPLRLC